MNRTKRHPKAMLPLCRCLTANPRLIGPIAILVLVAITTTGTPRPAFALAMSCPSGQTPINACGWANKPAGACGTALTSSGVVDWGTCPTGQTCSSNQCTVTAAACTGLCLQQIPCLGGGTTSVSGTVTDPRTGKGLPAVVVYVPNGGPPPTFGVQAFPPGVASPPITGSPLVQALTAANGSFSLRNVPVGTNIPLIAQQNHWRLRGMAIPNVAACTNTVVALRMPLTPAQGDLP